MRTRAGWGSILGLAVLMTLPAGPALAESEPPAVELPAGAHVGLVNLLDPEVTHFHAAKELQSSFLKTYTVNWPVLTMLTQALQARLTQLGLAPVVLEATLALRDAREACFLNASLAKGLPKECRQPFGQCEHQPRGCAHRAGARAQQLRACRRRATQGVARVPAGLVPGERRGR